MAFDPITMALCRGDTEAGETALAVINIETTLRLSETVELTKEESIALSKAFWELRPIIAKLNLGENYGVVSVPLVFLGALGFVGNFSLAGGMFILTFARGEGMDFSDVGSDGGLRDAITWFSATFNGAMLEMI